MEMAQVGVRTRAQAALAMEPASSSARTSKRRKININKRNEEPKVKPEPEPATEAHFSDVEFPASCCSSNGSGSLDEERIKSLDLEVESAQVETSTCNCVEEIERREMNQSNELRGNSQSMETNSRRRLSTAQKMPTESELEEFFAAAEKDIQKRFQAKYNYDIVKDIPLEGRYEWVQLKP